MIRKPAVAGQFYPGSPERLRSFLSENVPKVAEPVKAYGVVAPHAGYVYSGHVAGEVFGTVRVPDLVLLLGPNHTGLGTKASVMSEGSWATPIGNAPIDSGLAQALRSACPVLEEDSLAHAHEHSLEVQLPFLLFRNPQVRIVPVALMLRSVEEIEELGHGLGSVLSGWEEPVLMVASSDMTHYETHESAKEKDAKAIDRVLNADPRGLLDTTKRYGITMCGVIPTAVLLFAARNLGASRGELIRYATSGETSGDYRSVVGYAGMMIV